MIYYTKNLFKCSEQLYIQQTLNEIQVLQEQEYDNMKKKEEEHFEWTDLLTSWVMLASGNGPKSVKKI